MRGLKVWGMEEREREDYMSGAWRRGRERNLSWVGWRCWGTPLTITSLLAQGFHHLTRVLMHGRAHL